MHFYDLVWGAAKIFFKRSLESRYGCVLHREDSEPAEPYLLLANHTHHVDAFLIGLNLDRPIRFMADRESSSLVKYLAGLGAGVFFRRLGRGDLEAIRKAHRLIRRGWSVGIFPDGRRTWDGESASDLVQTARLAKLFDRAVRLVRVEGLYRRKPRWALHGRSGESHLYFQTLSRETVRNFSVRELALAMEPWLHYNEIKAEKDRPLTGDRVAEGVENLLWLCPECGGMDSLYGRDDLIICRQCRREWRLDPDLTIRTGPFEDLKDWSDWQKSRIPALVEQSDEEEILLSPESRFRETSRRGRREREGTLFLCGETLVFREKKGGVFSVPLSKIRFSHVLFNHHYYFSVGIRRYRLTLPGKAALKLRQLEEHIKGRRGGNHGKKS